jgi:hypothetical protein
LAVTVPLLAAALSLLALLPWLLLEPRDIPWAIGTIALVAYPIALVGVMLVAVFVHRKLPDLARAAARITYWSLFAAFVVAIAFALLMPR